MEFGERQLSKNPRKSANIISVLFIGWSIPLFKRSYTKHLHPNDIYEALDVDRSKSLCDRLEKAWQAEKTNHAKPYLARAVLKTFWCELLFLGILGFFTNFVINLASAFVLKEFLEFFQESSEVSRDDAIKYGISIFVLTVAYGMCFAHYFYHSEYYAMKIRVALTAVIYRKALRLSQQAVSETAPGKLVNLLSNDVQRFQTLSTWHPLWFSPIATVAATYVLWNEIRWAGILGVAIILTFIPIQSFAGKVSASIRFKTAVRTDERARLMDEIISGIQVIKMYAWEKPFQLLIAVTRKLELKHVLNNSYIRVFYMTIALFTTRFALFCSIFSFVLFYGSENITVSKMFMAAYLFNVISGLMSRLFVSSFSAVGEALIALKRLQMFLEYQEKVDTNPETIPPKCDQNNAIVMSQVTAKWCRVDDPNVSNENTIGKDSNALELKQNVPFNLQDINLQVPRGKLIFVVGSTAAGKSTLLQVLLKELPLASGSITINGSISYASQESWIFTSTIRQNITFGLPMDRSRYDEVIKSTALAKDLTQFSDGDLTLVGEHGAGLSGGQKARINLARAMYRNADIYLIDDPLSAVDAHVQSHLFTNCLGSHGFLAQQNATRILVTHQLHFLKEANWIVVLKEGKIEAQGEYDEIMRSKVDFTTIINQNEEKEEEEAEKINETAMETDVMKSKEENLTTTDDQICSLNEEKNDSKVGQTNTKEGSGMLKELEASSKGKVKGSLLLSYFKSSNQPYMLVMMIVTFLLAQALASIADVWVSYWINEEEIRRYYMQSYIYRYANVSNDKLQPNENAEPNLWPTETFAYIYVGIMALFFIITSIRSVIFSNICIAVSRNLHDTMLHRLMSTAMQFFDENPVGRITNRFTKDLGCVDEILPKAMIDAFQNNLNVLGAIIVTIFTDLKLSIVIFLLSIVFVLVRKIYLRSSTNIKRMEGITKSPVFTHISATLEGLSTVRAFHAENILEAEFEDHQDLNTGTLFMFIGVSNGFSMLLGLLVYIFIGVVLYIFLAQTEEATGYRVGLAITQSLSLAISLQMAVLYSADVDNLMMSVERVLEYCQLVPETQPDIPVDVPKDWPSNGKVEFKNVSYRYVADGEPVLRGLTFSVEPKEKVSVVGRTGAGKSSLISSIFRLAVVDGDILLDNVNTSHINLSVLRSHVSIIPQEPVLFSGTLRRNIDPFDEYSDDDIWRALESVELKEFVSKDDGLNMPVMARGQNFSTGQRQILCLARAILRRNKIIILDEATANVDLQTDAMLQRTIRDKFADCTVITVAHRLNTVIDSDRILVMDAGTAIEFDAPLTLLQNPKGVFHKMVKALGSHEYDRLYSTAEVKFNQSL